MMKRYLLFLFAVVVLIPALALAQQSPPPPQNVILISWDGVDRNLLHELLDEKKLPNTARLIEEGSLQEIEIVGHATHTKPGHATMLTGLSAETTGVFANNKYQPIPEGLTIFERLQKHFGGKGKIRTIFVASKIGNVGGRGPGEIPFDPQKADADVLESVKKGEPYFQTKKRLDVFDAENRSASQTVPVFLDFIKQNQTPRFFAFLHLAEPDYAGHTYGSNSKEYREATVVCDEWLGKIVDWLKAANLYDQTLIYLTSDHGFDKNSQSHNNAPNVWLVTNDKAVKRGGNLADIPATILKRLGVDGERLEPRLIGQPLTE